MDSLTNALARLRGGVFGTLWGWGAAGAIAVWRSFWAVWGNPMTYPIIGVVALGMFVAGHHAAARHVAPLKAVVQAVTAQNDRLQAKLAAAEVNEAAARKAAKEALEKAAALEKALGEKFTPAAPIAPRRPAAARATPATAKPWSLFGQ